VGGGHNWEGCASEGEHALGLSMQVG
jgi:hypothetical protein